jgi:hypothetical protein
MSNTTIGTSNHRLARPIHGYVQGTTWDVIAPVAEADPLFAKTHLPQLCQLRLPACCALRVIPNQPDQLNKVL